MPSLANANVQSKVIRALKRVGFERRSGGKHTIMEHPDGRYTVIPNHTRLKVGTLRAILEQCELSEAEFIESYKGKRKRR